VVGVVLEREVVNMVARL